ncbi:hypothetical protein B0H10DRAFT_2221577 [Mycena sp. CBHHK59/15]|nr:hypothetical protein B0H10DRAFT_2221577 [Mycena sp. CBHHK59/15]
MNSTPSPLTHLQNELLPPITKNAAATKVRAQKDKKAKDAHCQILQDCQNKSNLTIEQPEDSPEMQELRAALVCAQGECNASRSPQPRGPPSHSITHPSNMSKVTISDICDHLDPSGAKNDQAWSNLTTRIHHFMDAGMLDMDSSWKEQDSQHLIKIYDAEVEAAYPDLERFCSQ